MKNMEKLIFLFILFSLIFSGCTLKEQNNRYVESRIDKLSQCEKKSGKEKDDCYMENIGESKNYNLCENVTDNSEKDKCYNGMALKNQNANLCEKIFDIDLKDWCYSIIALETKNFSLCEKITSAENRWECLKYSKQQD